MRFKVTNLSTFRTYIVPGVDGAPTIELRPGATAIVSDTAKDMLVAAYNNGNEVIGWKPSPKPTCPIDPNIYPAPTPIYGPAIQVLGPAADGSAVGQKSVAVSGSDWLVTNIFDAGRYVSSMTISNTGATDMEISFSGFTAPTTAPDPGTIISIASGTSQTVTFPNSNLERYFIYRSTGTATTAIVRFQ